MKKIIILLIIICASIYSYAMVNHHDTTISTPTTWFAIDNPHNIYGNITISSGATLTIQPGVNIVFYIVACVVPPSCCSVHHKFIVYGGIDAEGTASDPITFTKCFNGDGWDGIYLDGPNQNSTFEYCIFEYANKTCYTPGSFPDPNVSGAVMYLKNTGPSNANISIDNCIFNNNQADYGGAIFSDNYDNNKISIYLNKFYNNGALTNGGAVYLLNDQQAPGPDITNCLFYHNYSQHHGGAIFLDDVNCNINHNTIILNTANTINNSYSGGGIFYTGGTLRMENTILYFNRSYNSADQIYPVPSSGNDIIYCDINGITPWFNSNNINANPKFVDTAGCDFRISYNNSSPCIDVGDNTANPMKTIDLKGDPRIDITNYITDMGAYEYEYPNIPYKISKDKSITNLQYTLVNTNKYIKLTSNFDDSKKISIILYNIEGQKLKTVFNGNINKGKQILFFNLNDYSPDIYFIYLKVSGYSDIIRKMIIY